MTLQPDLSKSVLASLQAAQSVLASFLENDQNILAITEFASLTAGTIRNGDKVISCGNGGSMCDAMHFAEELTGRFRKDRISLPALAISDPSHLTCTANDFGFEAVFARFVEGVGNAGDLLLGISTSGNSANIIKAVQAAKDKKMKTVCLLGKSGGALKDQVDLPIVIPAETSDRIQEVHIKIIHIVIETVEKILKLA